MSIWKSESFVKEIIGKKGEAVLSSQYGTLFQYSECIVILIWPVIQQHIKHAVMSLTWLDRRKYKLSFGI